MTASGQLRLPSYWGEVPAKSISTSSPATVTAARISSSPSSGSSQSSRLVTAVGEAAMRRAHHALGVAVQLVHRGVHRVFAAPLDELLEPALGETMGGELRAEVAAALLGIAHVREEDASAARRRAERAAG